MDKFLMDHIHKTGAAIVASDEEDERQGTDAGHLRMPGAYIHSIAPAPTDAQLGEQYRQEMRNALTHVCSIMTRANRDKIGVAYSLGVDAFGQSIISQLVISKVLT
jgi:hypothetical protein